LFAWFRNDGLQNHGKNNILKSHVKSVHTVYPYNGRTIAAETTINRGQAGRPLSIASKSTACADSQRLFMSGQRPVFKDFFLTKRSTADSKSQASPPVFFPVGGIASHLNNI
jgi:hypothetical protein